MIETEDAPPLLFDTGADGATLMHNMKRLGIDPMRIGESLSPTLMATKKNALCWEDNLHIQIMLIAQAPGKNEDREGWNSSANGTGGLFHVPAGEAWETYPETQKDKRMVAMYMGALFNISCWKAFGNTERGFSLTNASFPRTFSICPGLIS